MSNASPMEKFKLFQLTNQRREKEEQKSRLTGTRAIDQQGQFMLGHRLDQCVTHGMSTDIQREESFRNMS